MVQQQDSKCQKNITRTALQARCGRIRELNDQLRQTLTGGRVMITAGVLELGSGAVAMVVGLVQAFDGFSSDNDPYQEHDFGSVRHASEQLFWKIDYYDRSLEFGSPDPADPSVTTRVLTIMLAAEY